MFKELGLIPALSSQALAKILGTLTRVFSIFKLIYISLILSTQTKIYRALTWPLLCKASNFSFKEVIRASRNSDTVSNPVAAKFVNGIN